MTENEFGNSFICIFSSTNSKPLNDWEYHVENGQIKRIVDPEIHSSVVEIVSSGTENTYITCPKDSNDKLRIKHQYVSIVVKNLKKFFIMEFTVLDDTNTKRTFKASNFIKKAHVKSNMCKLPLKMVDNWNVLTFNLNDLTNQAYGTNFSETIRITLHSNCHLRRIHFSDNNLSEDEIPIEYRLVPAVTESN